MPRTVAAALAAGLLLAGCAADSPIVERALVMPSGFETLSCPELVAKYKSSDVRMKELAGLMEKSGSPIANALAYDTEYATARASKRFAEQAAEKKHCELADKPASLEPPPAPAQTNAKK
ncbi:MAG: hypothetical protein JO328_11325 [Hyphomicrobiales bacterium]|nr:hypothetical protein [Hyphomicrobiales bacterium]MBV8826282.1 hypothetical protein [Hyphomicrobiales bacterium]MBV9429721.1 hypothetical protein [Bradyrhizobiaceae bacterium]